MTDKKKTDNPEEELAVGDWKIVDLPKMDIKDVEEGEDVLIKYRSKIYRWKDNEWKERGLGNFLILKNKETKKIRALHM